MSRMRRGWELTKKSWGVLRANPKLFRFPVYSGLAIVPLALVTWGPGLYFIEEDELGAAIPLIAIGLLILTFISVFFAVGLAAAADRIFRGEEATVGDGLAVARQNVGAIFGWSVFSAIVGTAFSALESQGTLGQIVGRILDIGWSLVTFLAVPVIAIEGTGPIATLKRSASLFKSRWGQQITGNIAIGGIVGLAIILPGALLVGIGIALWTTSGFGAAIAVLVGGIVMLIGMVIQRAMSGVFGVALYHYAAEGEATGGFTAAELDSAVRPKRGPSPQPA